MNTSLLKKSVATCAVAMAFAGGAAPSFATVGVKFCGDGNGCAGVTASQFVWQQNSFIVDNGFNNNAGATDVASVFKGQGQMSGTSNNSVTTSDNRFTYVFSIDVTTSKTGSASGDSFKLVDGQATLPTAVTATNYFRIYSNTGGPNLVAGTGFDNGLGNLILEGTVVLDSNGAIADTNGNGTTFQISNATPVPINKTAGPQGAGTTSQGGVAITTVQGSGNVTIDVNVLTANTSYFRTDISSLSLDVDLSGNLNDPFIGVTVPAMVDLVTPNFGTPVGGTLRNDFTCNATGTTTSPCDMIFASNGGATSNINDEFAPEPATLALLGLGLLGLGRMARTRKLA